MNETAPRQEARIAFLNREAAEVYLLLDFLSGRTDRSIRPSTAEQGQSLLQERVAQANPAPSGVDDTVRRTIEEDLKDPTRLLLRAMAIKYPLEEKHNDFEANAAFLLRARDVLNARADPASGATIAFTTMVSAERARIAGSATRTNSWEFAEAAYPWLRAEAARLDHWARCRMWVITVVFWLAVVISGYACWGKVMLDTLDAVRADDKATQNAVQDQIAHGGLTDPVTKAPFVVTQWCGQRTGDIASNDICYRVNDIKVRKQITHYNLARWENPFGGLSLDAFQDPLEQKRTEQNATAMLTVLGNYLMPIFYGYLGSLAYVLRRFNDKLTESCLSPRDYRSNRIRSRLGAMIGGCIGLVYSGSGLAQTTGTLGLAITLSTSALAFLAGYGVEAVFKSLDTLITQVFGVNGTSKTPPSTAH